MLASELSQDWWRPERAAAPASGLVPDTDLAFKALVAFTAILLLAPQEWFPVLKSLRIALLAATVSFVAYMFDSAVQRRPVSTFSPEMGICLALVTWSILTIPLSYWPGGSVTELTEHFLKAVAFFWLIGTLVITKKRLMVFTWTLVLCSIPLAATGVANFLSGEFVTSRRAAVQRIAGYAGSGIASNPNDLALMLNLLIPITGALLIMTKKVTLKAVAALTLLLAVTTVVITFSRAGFIALITIVLLVVDCAHPPAPSGSRNRGHRSRRWSFRRCCRRDIWIDSTRLPISRRTRRDRHRAAGTTLARRSMSSSRTRSPESASDRTSSRSTKSVAPRGARFITSTSSTPSISDCRARRCSSGC